MKFRRIIAAAVSTVALLAVNVGMADSAAAGSSWSLDTPVQTEGSSWSVVGKSTVKPAGSSWS